MGTVRVLLEYQPAPKLHFSWLTKKIEIKGVEGNWVTLSQWISVSCTLLQILWCLKVSNCFKTQLLSLAFYKWRAVRGQCCVTCLLAWIPVAWGGFWAGKQHVKKTWEWTPASLGVSRTCRWKLQQMEVAASGGCSLSCDSPAAPPKHSGATASKGDFQLFWLVCCDQITWWGHLDSGGGDFYMGDWAELLECIASYLSDGFQLLWYAMCDSKENMKVTSFSSIAHMSWVSGGSIPCRMHPRAWLLVFLSLGTLCAAPAFPHAVGAAVLACTVPCWVPFSLGMFSCSPGWKQHPCRAAAAVGEGVRTTGVLLGCTAGTQWPVGKLLHICSRSWRGLTELAGAAARWCLQLFGFFSCCFAALKSEACFQLGSCSQSQCCSK